MPGRSMSENWLDQAACKNADPRIFYAFTAEDHHTALTYCQVCPVTVQCANRRIETERALDTGTPGVWGGIRWTTNTKRLRRAVKGNPNLYRTPNAYKCNQGHPRTLENTYTAPDGRKHCRICRTQSKQRQLREATG